MIYPANPAIPLPDQVGHLINRPNIQLSSEQYNLLELLKSGANVYFTGIDFGLNIDLGFQ